VAIYDEELASYKQIAELQKKNNKEFYSALNGLIKNQQDFMDSKKGNGEASINYSAEIKESLTIKKDELANQLDIYNNALINIDNDIKNITQDLDNKKVELAVQNAEVLKKEQEINTRRAHLETQLLGVNDTITKLMNDFNVNFGQESYLLQQLTVISTLPANLTSSSTTFKQLTVKLFYLVNRLQFTIKLLKFGALKLYGADVYGVASWLQLLDPKFSKYVNDFLGNGIDKVTLQELDLESLQELGVSDFDAKKILDNVLSFDSLRNVEYALILISRGCSMVLELINPFSTFINVTEDRLNTQLKQSL